MVKENRVCRTRIGTPQQNYIRLLNFFIGTCTSARTKDRRQTGDARGVSSPVTAINVVRPHDGAHKFLCRIVQLVRGLGAAEHAEVPRIFLIDGFAERRRDAIHRFIPCSGTMRAVVAYQWLSETEFRWFRHHAPQDEKR